MQLKRTLQTGVFALTDSGLCQGSLQQFRRVLIRRVMGVITTTSSRFSWCVVFCCQLFFCADLTAQAVSQFYDEITCDRPLVGRELFRIDLPAAESDRQIDIILQASGKEILLARYFVDQRAATLSIGEEELWGPDPGRLPQGQVITRIHSGSDEVLDIPTISKLRQTPWYPKGSSQSELLDRVARKIRDGNPVSAYRDLKSVTGKFDDKEQEAEWYRLNASILDIFSRIDQVNAPRASRDLDYSLELAPPSSKVRAKVLIDRASKSRNSSFSDSDAGSRRRELIQSLEDARASFAIADYQGDRRLAAAALVEVALTSAARGWLSETRSAALSARDYNGDLDTRWRTDFALAMAHEARGEWDQAIDQARSAVAVIERIRQIQKNDSAVLFHRRGPALLLTRLLATSGDVLGSLQVTDLLRVRRPGDEIPALKDLQKLAQDAQGSHTIQVLVDAGQQLLNWWTEEGEWKFAVRSHQPGELNSRIEQLHASRGKDTESAKWISDRVFGDVTSINGRLLLIPLDALRRIPWSVLPIEGRMLLERAAVSLLPNLNAAERELSFLPAESWISVVDSDVPDKPRLSGAREEGLHIGKKIADSAVLSGTSATISALWSGLPGREVLHIGCHGDFDPRDPSASILYLTPEKDHPSGKLYASELADWDLSDVRLLLLTGCETALAGGPGADDLAGFTGAALEAGCRGVLGSLWPVEDEVTRQMTINFIESAAARMSPSEALRAACRSIRDVSKKDQVSAWSGWVLVENGR
ncbi:MAG: hypothetical protein CBC13_00885 [Planctomycetia bacterium TMED53]|nr:MAG: hypothetical protein CBC13_00885 [Planctomycetia bacterium TMED53]